ncbi:MAG: helix-turn-helix transcriptional regulator [Oscillibacter sp.]|jgi:transcriptional regulator with XRE-family HTH domain|nr:helix-turn-helix transcriptional regulator [Oscillibacter sp.]
MNFAEHLTFLRENRAITQNQMAKTLGISVHGYQRFEYGQQEPRMSILVTLADFFDISLDELVCRDWPKER